MGDDVEVVEGDLGVGQVFGDALDVGADLSMEADSMASARSPDSSSAATARST